MYAQEPTFDPEDCLVLADVWHRRLERALIRVESQWGWTLKPGSKSQAQMIHGTFHDYWISHFTDYQLQSPDKRPEHHSKIASRASVVIPLGKQLGSLILILPKGSPDDWGDSIGLPFLDSELARLDALPYMTELAIQLSETAVRHLFRWMGRRIQVDRGRVMCFDSQGFDNKIHRLKDAFLLLRTPMMTMNQTSLDVMLVLKLAECWDLQSSLRLHMSKLNHWDQSSEAETLLQLLLDHH
jgi:hypothetical protein